MRALLFQTTSVRSLQNFCEAVLLILHLCIKSRRQHSILQVLIVWLSLARLRCLTRHIAQVTPVDNLKHMDQDVPGEQALTRSMLLFVMPLELLSTLLQILLAM